MGYDWGFLILVDGGVSNERTAMTKPSASRVIPSSPTPRTAHEELPSNGNQHLYYTL